MFPIQTKNAPRPIGPYSQAIIHGDLIFCSGQIALDPKTMEMIKGDVKKQTEQVLKNLTAIIEEANSSMEKVIKTTIYLKNMSDFPIVNEIYSQFFQKNKPARSTIEVAKLPKDALIEIDLIAGI